ncbi:MAG: hypothetical protein H6658_15010 [Ardenticatenaceae bacterium]|nr:hypothetical protein [Ardenticatenaceae bacterium]
MDSEIRHYNQRFLTGCVIFVSLAALIIGGLLWASFQKNRQLTRYPDSLLVASHSNYRDFPLSYKWDDTYLTDAPFREVYNWYSVTFDMGAEARATGGCIWLESQQQQWLVQRNLGVSLCDTPNGRMIFVSQTTAYR